MEHSGYRIGHLDFICVCVCSGLNTWLLFIARKKIFNAIIFEPVLGYNGLVLFLFPIRCPFDISKKMLVELYAFDHPLCLRPHTNLMPR